MTASVIRLEREADETSRRREVAADLQRRLEVLITKLETDIAAIDRRLAGAR